MIQVLPGPVRGRIRVPPSKSHLQRVLLAASLATGQSRILNAGQSEDGQACIGVIQALGAEVVRDGEALLIRGGGAVRSRTLDCGESGFCLRAAAAVAALGDQPVGFTLLGHGSLAARPMDMVLEPLRQLGVVCATRDGRPPLTVRGPIRGGRAQVDGTGSSQFLSGLLLALPRAGADTELAVSGLRSSPYVRMTLEVLAAFGAAVTVDEALTCFQIKGGQSYRARQLSVEGDWSGAAFLLVAGALAGDLELEGLDPASAQADRAILEALTLAGAEPAWEGSILRIRQSPLQGFHFDASDCPDLFPPLAALACHAHGQSRIYGAGRLHHKESDRAAALVSELTALGARVAVDGDVMVITGGALAGGRIDPHRDHRMAMAGAVAALKSRDGVMMEGEACVAKSYPDFFPALFRLQGKA
jgi:3-phosphoshikimate 1-carboxyvinyltransferase